MAILLRNARRSDYAAINELATALLGFAAERRTSFETVLASPDHDLITAEADGQIVGYAHLLTYEDLSHGKLAGELLSIAVREDSRAKGVGTALFGEVCRRAKERGVHELHINTEAHNMAACRLYRKLGAKVVGVQFEVEVEHGP